MSSAQIMSTVVLHTNLVKPGVLSVEEMKANITMCLFVFVCWEKGCNVVVWVPICGSLCCFRTCYGGSFKEITSLPPTNLSHLFVLKGEVRKHKRTEWNSACTLPLQLKVNGTCWTALLKCF